jgi:hypothetical protein
MFLFNHWRRGKQIKIFVPRTVIEVKSGKYSKKHSGQVPCSSCAGVVVVVAQILMISKVIIC